MKSLRVCSSLLEGIMFHSLHFEFAIKPTQGVTAGDYFEFHPASAGVVYKATRAFVNQATSSAEDPMPSVAAKLEGLTINSIQKSKSACQDP